MEQRIADLEKTLNVLSVHKNAIHESRVAILEKKLQEINNMNNYIYMDRYTKSVLNDQFNIHKEYVMKRLASSRGLNIKFRLPSIPEDISENIIKFIIQKMGDASCTWNCKGDLYSTVDKKIECKCFTSTGPISFTPSSGWNVIYFLDDANWLDDKFKLYRANLTYDSDAWKNVKVNKTESFQMQANNGRRPRIGWNTLYPQIMGHCELVFDGGFDDIVG